MLKINNWKDKLWTFGIFALVMIFYLVVKPTCPMLRYLHIPCPCCGMTRAWFCVLRMDLAGAIQMHGMFWSVPVLVLYYLFDGKVFSKPWLDRLVLILIAMGFFINWIWNLI